jgi:hypothetical protein
MDDSELADARALVALSRIWNACLRPAVAGCSLALGLLAHSLALAQERAQRQPRPRSSMRATRGDLRPIDAPQSPVPGCLQPQGTCGRRRDSGLHPGSPDRAANESCLKPMSELSETASGLMANERDAQGNTLCPVCREVIRDPDLRPFMGDQRVHEHCWSSPRKPWNQ